MLVTDWGNKINKSVYYNDIEPFSNAWLRELMRAGVIPTGDVDERNILDAKPDDVRLYNQCHFFAGIGVWPYALKQAGWGNRPVWTGSCPCQPFSAAGKGAGFADERHVWPYWFHLIRTQRPEFVFGEQVASKNGLAWLDLVQTDLEGAGYTLGAVDTCAAGFGAPHIRQRLCWVAHTNNTGSQRRGLPRPIREWEDKTQFTPWSRGATNGYWSNAEWIPCLDGKARPIEPGTFPLANGANNRMGRLRGYGNALVAPQAIAFVKAVMGDFGL